MNEIKTPFEQRLEKIEQSIETLQKSIIELQTDFNDWKEAFEHTDDSLHNLRQTVSGQKIN